MFACRKNGRSYLGILDDVESSLFLLNIPFTDINNIVLLNTLCSLSFCSKTVNLFELLIVF